MQAEGLAFSWRASFSLACHLAFLQRVVGQGFCPVPPGWRDSLFNQVGDHGGKESPITFDLTPKPAMRGAVCIVESDCELRPKLSLEPDQEKPPEKKKSLWQKIKDFFIQEPEGRSSGRWRVRELNDW